MTRPRRNGSPASGEKGTTMELIAESALSMQEGTERPEAGTRRRLWIGRALSGVAILFLALDGVAKVLEVPQVLEGSRQLGYPETTVFGIGVALLASLLLHVIPRTAVIGAVLLTGYLGGAVATHVRVGNPVLSHVLFPTYVAVLFWGGLYLRDPRLRAVLSARGRA